MIELPPAQSFVILGVDSTGRRFRPSDWADRLCGVMSSFRPSGRTGDHLSYSPLVQPSMRDGHRCVVVDARLRDIEPMAYDFLRKFARDKDLVVPAGDIPELDRPSGQAPRSPRPVSTGSLSTGSSPTGSTPKPGSSPKPKT